MKFATLSFVQMRQIDPNVESLALITRFLAFHASYDPRYSLTAQFRCDFSVFAQPRLQITLSRGCNNV